MAGTGAQGVRGQVEGQWAGSALRREGERETSLLLQLPDGIVQRRVSQALLRDAQQQCER